MSGSHQQPVNDQQKGSASSQQKIKLLGQTGLSIKGELGDNQLKECVTQTNWQSNGLNNNASSELDVLSQLPSQKSQTAPKSRLQGSRTNSNLHNMLGTPPLTQHSVRFVSSEKEAQNKSTSTNQQQATKFVISNHQRIKSTASFSTHYTSPPTLKCIVTQQQLSPKYQCESTEKLESASSFDNERFTQFFQFSQRKPKKSYSSAQQARSMLSTSDFLSSTLKGTNKLSGQKNKQFVPSTPASPISEIPKTPKQNQELASLLLSSKEAKEIAQLRQNQQKNQFYTRVASFHQPQLMNLQRSLSEVELKLADQQNSSKKSNFIDLKSNESNVDMPPQMKERKQSGEQNPQKLDQSKSQNDFLKIQ